MRLIRTMYALLAYTIFLVSFVYAIGFVGNLVVPKSIDAGEAGDLLTALLVDLVLLGAFAVQHSLMARPAFKRWWTQWVSPAIERSTYVLISSLLLLVLYAGWQPMPDLVWQLQSPASRAAAWSTCAVGWVIVLCSTFMISHVELFGLKQAIAGVGQATVEPRLVTRMLYRFVRHPIMLGFIIAFWATPDMSQGHLLFAAMTTGYILVGVWLEERDLVDQFGIAYRTYQRRVPMLLPVGGAGVDGNRKGGNAGEHLTH